ncbi:hypothetical protein [Polaribacter sp. Asnod6-C07]|uniref:hypothetical protein n=1 Tax=Polaribacter sp. Asnod6-C07 TaxID=3160582 RepID=UPI00386C05C2
MNKDKIAIIIVFIIIGLISFKHIKEHKELSENQSYTEGKISDYYYIGAKTYIKYIFYVDRKKYTGEERVYPFKCENGIYGCVGKTIKVFYSSKNPNNNEIDLGDYNKYRPNKIRFFKINN